MVNLSRRAALAMFGTVGRLLGLGCVLRNVIGEPRLGPVPGGIARADGPGMMGASGADMATYMEMFNRHNEIRRSVEEIPGGVRTTTATGRRNHVHESKPADTVWQRHQLSASTHHHP